MKLKPLDKFAVNIAMVGSLCLPIAPISAAIADSINNLDTKHLQVEIAKLQQLLVRANEGDAGAQFNLAKLYLEGWNIQQDVKSAVQLIKSSARLGNPDAQYTLGVMYASGDGVKYSPSKAVEWLERASKQGSSEASFYLTTILGADVDIGC